jgi:hypothetical protein
MRDIYRAWITEGMKGGRLPEISTLIDDGASTEV